MKNPKYMEAKESALAYGDDGYCSIAALSIALDVPYSEVRQLMCSLGVWDSRRGQWMRGTDYWSGWVHVLGEIGIDWHSAIRPVQSNGSQYTMKTIGKAYPKGTYIVEVRGHVAAMIDGEVIDWTAERRHRVRQMYKVS